MKAIDLTCEYATTPLGIDTRQPRFGWVLQSEKRAQTQTAYQILVASSERKLAGNRGDVWRSRKVKSEQSFNIPYEGRPLASAETCWWKVKVWDAAGNESDWSEPALFETALLEKSDWQGRWIGAARGVPAPLLRKEFKLPGKPKRARLYVSGIGWSEAYLNGGKVSDRVLDPCASEYGKSVYYVCHDVTEQLQRGANAIGLWLGNGWYSEPEWACQYGNCPQALVQLNVEMAGGKTVSIVSDGSWKASGSCITLNDLWHGEIYDARQETPGWASAGLDDAAWDAAEIKDAPGPVPNRPADANGRPEGAILRSQIMPPIKVVETRKAKRVTEPRPGTYLFDFGQLFGGWVRLRVKGPAGTKVIIKYSGRVYEDSGLIDKRRHETPKATDYYILKGDAEGEVYEPRFTYHPVCYVQIEDAPGALTVEDVDGCVVHTAEDLSGDFECANEVLNQTHRNVVWTVRNGLFGMPLDCLQREHWAWTDPATITGSLYPRKYMPRFWTKWLRDVADSQAENGQVPQVCPAYHGQGWDAAWGGNYPQLVWYLHQYYGDDRILAEHYDGIKRVVDFQVGIAEDDIMTRGIWGDHMLPGTEPGGEECVSSETPQQLVWTSYFYRGALVVSQAAEVLGHADDAATYRALAERIRDAFNAKWLDTGKGAYATGSQTAQALPLAVGIVPDAHRERVIDCLIRSITEQYDNHHHTGNSGTTCLIDNLRKLGYGEVMWKIASNTTYPGWGYMVANGATTIWESWSLVATCGASENMIMWATIDEFFYNDLAGIEGPEYYGTDYRPGGFRQIRIAPFVPQELDHAKGFIRTAFGTVASAWRTTPNGIALDVEIPANTTATVCVPKLGAPKAVVTEGEKDVWRNGTHVEGVEGIAGAAECNDFITFEVGSGSYRFELKAGGQ